jgi:hypothetical protein
MTLPLALPLDVVAGDVIDVSFAYRAGGSIPSLQASIVTARVPMPMPSPEFAVNVTPAFVA